MTNPQPPPKILAIEPNSQLTSPYKFLQDKYQLTFARNVKQAITALSQDSFALFMLSASLNPDKQVLLLDAFKQQFKNQVIPLIVVVDLTRPISTVVGTQWSGKVEILHPLTAKELTLLTVESLMSA